jgi:hypothetical protein
MLSASGGNGGAATPHRGAFFRVYPFDGFQAPTAAYPTVNSAKAGDAAHLRFSLAGDRGLGVVASAAWAPCDGSDGSAAKTSLSYKSSGACTT